MRIPATVCDGNKTHAGFHKAQGEQAAGTQSRCSKRFSEFGRFLANVKGFSRKDSKFTRISEGDIDYADVRKALLEINFYGWLAAEVGGGDANELKRIAGEMDAAFGLA